MPLVRGACTRCGGTGQLIEYRLVWEQPRPGLPNMRCSRRLESEDEGRERLAELPPDATQAAILSGARPCSCRPQPSSPAPEKKTRALQPRLPVASPPEVFDWKMRQAGGA